MEEQKVFQEDDIAITTHRIVWGDDVFWFSDVEHVLFLDNDTWKALAFGIIVGVIGLAIAKPWSVVVGLVVFSLVLWIWINRKDEILIQFEDGRERRFILKSKTGLYSRIREAKNRRDALVRDVVAAGNRSKANAARSEIDSLPS